MKMSDDYMAWKTSNELRYEGFKLAFFGDNVLTWYYGYINERYCFRIEAQNCEIKPVLKSSKVIEVSVFPEKNKLTILFELIRDEYLSQFISLFENFYECSSPFTKADKAIFAIAKSFARWAKMFTPEHPSLSESQVQGLFGELSYIFDESKRMDIKTIIESWCGIDYEEVDFVFPDFWAEIKTRSRLRSTISISSPGQLDHSKEGWLVVYSVDDDELGLSLNDLFQIVLNLVRKAGRTELEDSLRNRLENFGYYVLPIYDYPKFVITEKRCFHVSESFPKVKRDVMLPNMKTLKYELIVDSLEEWRVK